MELIFLGTSSALPTKHRNHSAIALKSFGEVFLFDCGEATQRQMSKMKLSPMKVNKIFVTHFHGDHLLGIPGMIQSMGFRGRSEPLHLFGPPGLFKITEYMMGLGYFSISFDIHVHEIEFEKNSEMETNVILESDDYKILACKTDHTVLNMSYCIYEKRLPKFIKDKAIELGVKPGPDFGKLQSGIPVKVANKIVKPEHVLGQKRKGRKIVYSGDTRPCKQMIEFARNANVLIHESTFESKDEDRAYETGHSTAVQAADIAKKAKVNKLILTHISTRYKETDILETQAKEIFENTVVAEDLMKIEVKRHGH
ncbi:MAG: ribonuclease Z [Euryarchaeota archaeon]|nr:ribonuclease Z [Euryarchaeota archaeon]